MSSRPRFACSKATGRHGNYATPVVATWTAAYSRWQNDTAIYRGATTTLEGEGSAESSELTGTITPPAFIAPNASEPESGSVSAQAAIFSRVTSGGTQRQPVRPDVEDE